jgi:hypothetical protein
MVNPIQFGVTIETVANERLSALAAASGASRSLFVQRLIENVPLDANGVPVWWPAEEYPHRMEETLPMTG